MTVISTHKDVAGLTLTFVAEIEASPDWVWQLWADPRQLERWWGPPSWPATFERHEFEEGGRALYHMTGPKGEKSRGWWRITSIDPPRRLELEDGFADERGEPVTTPEPMRVTVTFEPVGHLTRMTIVSTFTSKEHLQQMLDMGMEEGMVTALGQIDAIIAS